MDFSSLKKNHQIDVYIPSTRSYHKVKLLEIKDNMAFLSDTVEEHTAADLVIGKFYLIYFGVGSNVYCGKTRLADISGTGQEPAEGTVVYIMEKPLELTLQERRRGTRVDYRKDVPYRLEQSATKEFDKVARATDLSKGGMRLKVTEAHELNTILILKLLVDSTEINAKARINWIKPGENCYLIGVSFQNIFLPV